MQTATGFNVLVVRADGRQFRRMGIPRWLVRAALALGAAGAVANVALVVDYTLLRKDHVTAVATRDRLEDRARAIEPLERRLTELRDEMRTWESLHAAILKPLGAERRPGTGVGGPAPAPGGEAIDEVDALLAHVREESHRLRALARVARETAGVLASVPSRLPLRGAINSGFGLRPSPWTGTAEFHAGIDLAASPGTPVVAPAGGVVRVAGAAPGYGNTVVLDHGRGFETRYGHLQTVGVAKGQKIERGQPIGLSGNTGRSTAPHLHYEVLVDGKPVDPRRLIRD